MVSRYLDLAVVNWHENPMSQMYAGRVFLGIRWSMAAMWRDVVVARSMPLAMLTMKKELHVFLFLYMHVVLYLKLWCSAWRSSVIIWLSFQVGAVNHLNSALWLAIRTGKIYGLLTKCEFKMAGYWPRSFLVCLWTSIAHGPRRRRGP